MKRFVVVCAPKCGSSVFGHSISTNTDIVYLDCIYTRNKKSLIERFNCFSQNKTGTFTNLINYMIEDEYFYNHFIEFRKKDWIRYTDAIVSSSDSFLGFKWHPYFDGFMSGNETHLLPEQLIEYADNKNIQYVIIERKNRFEQFVSLYISQKTNYFGYHDRNIPDFYHNGIFMVDDEISYLSSMAQLMKRSQSICDKLSQRNNSILLYYEDIIDNKVDYKITEYFKINNYICDTKRIYRPYSSFFDQYDRVREIYESVSI